MRFANFLHLETEPHQLVQVGYYFRRFVV